MKLILSVAWSKVLKATASIAEKFAVWSYLIPGITFSSNQKTLAAEIGASTSMLFTVPSMDKVYEFDLIQTNTLDEIEWYWIRIAIHGDSLSFNTCATSVSSMAINLAEFIGATVDYDAKTIELQFQNLTDTAVTITAKPSIKN